MKKKLISKKLKLTKLRVQVLEDREAPQIGLFPDGFHEFAGGVGVDSAGDPVFQTTDYGNDGTPWFRESELHDGIDVGDSDPGAGGTYCAAGDYCGTGVYCGIGMYCGNGSYCADGDYCGNGAYCGDGNYCANGTYCGDGWYCADGDYCANGTYCGAGNYCGGGVYCGAGNYCGAGTYCAAGDFGTGGGVDGDYSAAGQYCADGQYCGAGTYCGDGQYCGAGTYCGNGQYCGTGEYCGNGTYCGSGTYCGDGNYAMYMSGVPTDLTVAIDLDQDFLDMVNTSPALQGALGSAYVAPAWAANAHVEFDENGDAVVASAGASDTSSDDYSSYSGGGSTYSSY